jgi:outer membrane protein TolC
MLLLYFLLSGHATHGQLKIEDLIQNSIQESYQLQFNNYQILRAETLNTKGVAGNLPRLSLSGNARTDINNIRLQFFDNREVNQNNADNYSAGGNLDLEYPLYEGGAKKARSQQLKLDLETSEVNYQIQKEALLRQLLNRLAEYQLHKSQMKVYAADTMYWADLMSLRKEMKSLGMGDETEIVQIESELNRSILQFQRAKRAANLARIQIESLSFIDSSVIIESDGLRTFLESKKVDPLDYEPALIKETELQLNQSNTLLAISKSALYPTLSLFAGYGFSWSRNAVGVLLSNQNFGPYGGITFNWMIYDGRRIKREKEAARLDVLSQQKALKQQKRTVDYAKRETQQGIRLEREIYRKEEKQEEILARQYQLFEDQYRAGETDILEVLDYRRQYRLSQLNKNNSEFQLNQYLIEWLYLDGLLRQW